MKNLKKRTFLLLLAGLTATVFASAQKQPLPEWQSQYAVGLNKLAPHTYVWPYANASDIEKPGGYEQSPYYMSLNGKWKFHWVKNPDNRPKDFYQPSYYTGGWADINVPGNWERQGYGTAIYVNETYEFDDKMFNFKKNPPLVPHAENEVGSYRRTFKVPADCRGIDRRRERSSFGSLPLEFGCLSGMSGYVAFERYRAGCVSLQYTKTIYRRLQTECLFG